MDAPVNELQRLEELVNRGRSALEEGRIQDALAAADEALEIEPTYLRILALKADALEKQGDTETAEHLRTQVREIRREAWKRQVEAEVRGQHDLMGSAIRHELP